MKWLRAVLLLVCVVILFENSYGCTCPEESVVQVIEKNSDKEDKNKLKVTTKCKDAAGKVLHTCNETSDNPFGPDVIVHSYSYRGVFNHNHGTNVVNVHDNKPEITSNNDEVETFD